MKNTSDLPNSLKTNKTFGTFSLRYGIIPECRRIENMSKECERHIKYKINAMNVRRGEEEIY